MTSAGVSDDVIVVLGPAATAMRRRLGPLAWCALEALHQRATLTGDTLIADVSVSTLATDLGVAKNTAHRAVKTLRSAGLLSHDQARGVAGRFDGSRFRLAVSDIVIARQKVQRPDARPPSRRGPRSGRGRQVVAAPAVGGFDEQLALLPLA